jgi:catechol 2,3-dioxygenase-like lactoylglutathione lyase family enzyme
MRIKLNSVLVGDQQKALDFYTEVLGFTKKEDIPMGDFRWLTVTSSDDPDGTELVLEPNAFPPAKTYQQALYDAGIAATAFACSDVQATYDSLKSQGVEFRSEPVDAGSTTIAVFEDTCGNLIQIYQA